MILSHKLHKMVVNPHISPMFKNDNDRLTNVVFELYEALLPHVLSCKHSYEIWDKVDKHFNLQMKAQLHQLRSELHSLNSQMHLWNCH